MVHGYTLRGAGSIEDTGSKLENLCEVEYGKGGEWDDMRLGLSNLEKREFVNLK